jgi:two-component system, response regulator
MKGRGESAQIILLVEDSEDDAELTELAFAEARVANPLVRVRTGEEALDWLFRRGKFEARHVGETPALVLLDLKLPGMSGHEVLAEIRASSETSRLPVVVLTTSTEESDRLSAYDRHANSYVRKPVDHDQFVAAVRQLGLYWTVMNEPPPRVSS